MPSHVRFNRLSNTTSELTPTACMMELTILPSFVPCAGKTCIWGIWCSVGIARIGIAVAVRLNLRPASSAMTAVTRSVRGQHVANAALIFA